jgi:formate hydrogenlyase subunit 3/multisubunit Na+/H+ antiporter MnhD subunit
MKARPSDGRDIQLDGRAGESGPFPEAGILKRLALAAATAFVAVNIWTGCPIFALWVGAQVVSERRVTMAAIFVIVTVLAVSVFASAVALSWLNATYDAMTGRPHVERRPAWMRSMNAEAESQVHKRVGITPIEQVVMLNVYVVVILLAVWYVFFAGPPLLHN